MQTPKEIMFNELTIPEKLAHLERAYNKGLITPWEFIFASLKAKGEISEEECEKNCELIDNYISEYFVFKSDLIGP